MPASDTQFAGSIPEMYDRLMVPLIFEPYAHDIAQRVQALKPQNILEIAAGTGVVTRAMAASLPAATRIVVTDLNLPMLDYNKAKLTGDARLSWRPADAQDLPFEADSFDVVVCQFGAMFFPDKVRAFGEARRVLKPGGRYVFNVWDKISENDFADEIIKALALYFPADPPRFMARTPHGYHEPQPIRDALAAAGFTEVTIDAVDAVSPAASPLDAAIAYCQGTPWRNEIEARDASRLEDATNHAAAALERRFGRGPIKGRIRALVITATA
ncbi:class I SAM-dependent methyltransferase [Rhodoplanes sp. Z2-YC6860]|uniref:class I SAM-dependent methyltransferase n=1 Tax=Rhodoplanes sp. Z2-YC6860 TaxID=674703 RepID=UPI00078E5D58|nr:class I SAM-dependent methyltransferase [Rhodoplanes sp. Z2-YC6860]AMN42510.1 type 11 methyltransferase [Rhodoplanes sp. Z2-YC6860]